MWHQILFKHRFARDLITSIFILLLAACDTITSDSTLTSIPGSTLLPASTNESVLTATAVIPEETPFSLPTFPLTFTPILEKTTTVDLPLPLGDPVSSWKGIPIMQGAIAGEEKEGGYSYTIKASGDQVKGFYDTEMPKIGWKFFATGKGETGSLLLMYQKDDKTFTVSIFEQVDLSLILLVQY